jgi:hypothetical protein
MATVLNNGGVVFLALESATDTGTKIQRRYGIRSADGKCYLPVQLDTEFAIDGMEVYFTGETREDGETPNQNMPLIELTNIRPK